MILGGGYEELEAGEWEENYGCDSNVRNMEWDTCGFDVRGEEKLDHMARV